MRVLMVNFGETRTDGLRRRGGWIRMYVDKQAGRQAGRGAGRWIDRYLRWQERRRSITRPRKGLV